MQCQGKFPRAPLKVLKDNGVAAPAGGLRIRQSENIHNIKKGMLVDVARRFSKDCNALGIPSRHSF